MFNNGAQFAGLTPRPLESKIIFSIRALHLWQTRIYLRSALSEIRFLISKTLHRRQISILLNLVRHFNWQCSWWISLLHRMSSAVQHYALKIKSVKKFQQKTFLFLCDFWIFSTGQMWSNCQVFKFQFIRTWMNKNRNKNTWGSNWRKK